MQTQSGDKDSQRAIDTNSFHTNVPKFKDLIAASAHHVNRLKSIEKISTGSKNLDNLLCSGIETKAVTEFYGASSSGKSQICHTLCTIVPQDKSQGGISGKSIYIDTEGKFRPERIVSIAQARGFNTIYTLSNIIHVRVKTSHHQESIIEKVRSLVDKEKSTIRLLIVDSIISNYRAEFSGARTLSERQQRLYQFMYKLSSMARTYAIAVVVTNQVNYSDHPYTPKPTGGNIIAHASNYRISLRRLRSQHNNDDDDDKDDDGNQIVATIVQSPYHLENKACFMLSEKGIEDINKDTLT
jgi:DNA repair protein RadA